MDWHEDSWQHKSCTERYHMYTHLQGSFVISNTMVKKLLNGVINNVIAVDIDVEKLDLCRVKQPQHRVAVCNCLLDGSLHLDKGAVE